MPDIKAAPFEEKIVFVSGKRSFAVRDLIDSALFRGELQSAWNELLRLRAAELDAEEQGLEYDDEAIDAGAERFRYEHDLITAEETEQWLADRGLTLNEFSAYFVRHYWGEQINQSVPEQLDYASASEELHELLRTELILSGELAQIAQRLSWRVAAFEQAEGGGFDPKWIVEEESSFLERCGLEKEDVPDWLEKIGRDQSWFDEALAMEAIHRRGCASLLSEKACEHEIATLRIPLTSFEVEIVELDSLDAAREALLCVREDGMSMEEVASEGRYPYRRLEMLLDDIPEELQQKFLVVQPGDALEPIARGDGFQVCRIASKVEPDIADPKVRERAEERILNRHFTELATRWIQWRFLFS
jgi:hypothetical protein